MFWGIGRLGVAENLTDFLLLKLLSTVVASVLCLCTIRGGEDHTVDELRYARTVYICQNFGHNALQKDFVLKFDIRLLLIACPFFSLRIFGVVWLLRVVGVGLDEAVEAG